MHRMITMHARYRQDQELWTTKFLVLWSNTVELTTTDSSRQLDMSQFCSRLKIEMFCRAYN